MVSASTMLPHAVGVGAGAHRLDELRDVGEAALPGDRQQPRLDEVLLARLEHDRALLVHERADPVEAGGGEGHRVPPATVAPDVRRTTGEVADDRLGDAVEGQDLVGEAGLGDRAGHAPDDRGRLVLHDHGAAGGADLGRAVAAVGAHAGQDDGQDGAVVGGDGRAEQRVDGGPAEVLRRALVEAGLQAGLGPRPCERTTRWWSPGARWAVPGTSGLPSAASTTRSGAEPVEPLGELAGEDGRHVLHDQDRHRERGRQQREHAGQRLGAAGGGADDQDGGLLARAGARGGRARTGTTGAAARAGPGVTGRPVSALIFGISCSRTLSIDWPTLPTLAGFVTYSFAPAESASSVAEAPRSVSVLNMMIGTRLCRPPGRADRPHRLDAVHLRHLDVHGDQVGLELVELGDGDLAVHGGAHDLDVGVCGQHVGHDLADDDGIVDDHHPDRVHACPPASLLGQPSRLSSLYRQGATTLERGRGTAYRETTRAVRR